MATRLAFCIHTALVLAWINALVIAAGTVVRTVLVHLTLAPLTVGERIAHIARQTGADRTFFVGVIVAGIALRICAARIRVAQVLLCERTAGYKGISRVCFRAAADRRQTT